MDFGNSTVMKMAETLMQYNTQRQGELNRNIANIDTPNYEARDLKPLDFDNLVKRESARLEMRATASPHMMGTLAGGGAFGTHKQNAPFETTPTGNSSDLEQQMAAVNDASFGFQLASNVYRKMQSMMRTAIGNRG